MCSRSSFATVLSQAWMLCRVNNSAEHVRALARNGAPIRDSLEACEA